jgi:hypothetical protein
MAIQTFLIGYDLNKPGQDYKDLFAAIDALDPARWHCLDSTWMINSALNAAGIRDALLPHIDSNDRLMVVTLAKGAAWTTSFNTGCQDWMRRYL